MVLSFQDLKTMFARRLASSQGTPLFVDEPHPPGLLCSTFSFPVIFLFWIGSFSRSTKKFFFRRLSFPITLHNFSFCWRSYCEKDFSVAWTFKFDESLLKHSTGIGLMRKSSVSGSIIKRLNDKLIKLGYSCNLIFRNPQRSPEDSSSSSVARAFGLLRIEPTIAAIPDVVAAIIASGDRWAAQAEFNSARLAWGVSVQGTALPLPISHAKAKTMKDRWIGQSLILKFHLIQKCTHPPINCLTIREANAQRSAHFSNLSPVDLKIGENRMWLHRSRVFILCQQVLIHLTVIIIALYFSLFLNYTDFPATNICMK